MPSTRISGVHVSGPGNTTLHTGRGRLLGFLVSHSQAAAQSVMFFDGAATLAVVYIAPQQCPAYIQFGADKQDGIEFAESLIANPGANCELNVWFVGY